MVSYTPLRTTALLTRPTLQYVLHVVQRGLQKKSISKKYGGRKANRQKYRIAEYKIGQTCQKLWDVCQENDTRDIKMETEYVKNVMGPKYIRIYSCVSSRGAIFSPEMTDLCNIGRGTFNLHYSKTYIFVKTPLVNQIGKSK